MRGAGVGVLQVALGVEVIVFALRLLGVVDPGAQHKPTDRRTNARCEVLQTDSVGLRFVDSL